MAERTRCGGGATRYHQEPPDEEADDDAGAWHAGALAERGAQRGERVVPLRLLRVEQRLVLEDRDGEVPRVEFLAQVLQQRCGQLGHRPAREQRHEHAPPPSSTLRS